MRMIGAALAGMMLLRLPAAPAEDAAPLDADAAKARLIELATGGEMTQELVAAFTDYAEARARRDLAAVVPADFWPWLDQNPDMKFNLLVGLHPQYNPSVVKSLQQLREKFGKEVDTHPNLALAFAFVHGAAPGGVREPLMRYLARDRPEPAMLESFEYYLQNERRMWKGILRTTPWRLLVFVADNEIPIPEREWALEQFGPRKPATMGHIYGKPKYDFDQIRGEPRIGDRPHTLANILKYGGICADRAYFASRVLKSCGIPAMWDAGSGKRGDHAWVAWLYPKGGGWRMTDSGRFDFDKYYTGNVFNPLTCAKMLDRDVELMAAGLALSERGYNEALIGCYVYEMFDEDARTDALDVLKTAVYRNVYCALPWRILARECAKGVLPLDDGKKMYSYMLREFKEYPDLTYEVLGSILDVKLETDEETTKQEIASNLKTLERTFDIYRKCGRPDLAVALRVLQGQYMERVGLVKNALLLYMRESETYVKQHYGFLDLFDSALKIMDDKRLARDKVRYISRLAPKVRQYQGSFNRKFKLVNPSFEHVVSAYVDALREVGNEREAEKWEKKLFSEEEE